MRKKLFCLLLVLVLALSCTGIAAFAGQPDRAYTYEDDVAVPSTNIFKVKKIVDETVMGTERLLEPTEIFVDKRDRVFIIDHYFVVDEYGVATDKQLAKVIILNKDYTLFRELRTFKYKEETLTLAKGASGLFFRESNSSLYIADTQNDRVLVSDLEGNVSKIYTLPEDVMLEKAKGLEPKRIIVDNMGIMYIVTGDPEVSVNGALMIDSANNFLGFYGTNKLKQTAAMKIDFMWRKILTAEQNAQSANSYQPVAFNNLFWSEDRFVYGVSPIKDNVASTVVKLNALGNNVFAQNIDFYSISETSKQKNMQLVDLTVDDEGVFTVIDSKTGRLFQYDENCNLLGIFGGYGNQKGLFLSPMGIESDSENNLLVLDAKKLTITVMTQTLYGEKIREANNLYNEGRYIESVNYWEEVLLMNPNFTRAYVGMGKACLAMEDKQAQEMFQAGKYEQAMDFFMMGKDKDGYAEAKAGLRDEIVRANFGLVAAVVILAMIGILGYDQIKAFCNKIVWKIQSRKGV
ncbi:MAG: hypothetical protein IJX01_06535 [Oscillospiraceae bacterium]|nr:hypothetical protein [Oscillospiraceae bacterium]